MKKILTVLIIVLVILVLGIRFVQYRQMKPEVQKEGLSRVKVFNTKTGDVVKTLHYTGIIKGINEVMVYPKVPGLLKEKLKKTGEKIKENEAIVSIDRDAEALEYSLSKVKSPVEGIVLKIFSEPGSRVTPSQPVARVGNMENIKVKFGISPQDLVFIEEGNRVIVDVSPYSDKKFTGFISKIGAALDRQSQKIPVEIELKNSDYKLKSGMACDLNVVIKERKNINYAPRSAVVSRADTKGVFIVDSDNIARWRPEIIELIGDQRVGLTGEVAPETQIIVEGNYGLIPDKKITPVK
ncbi:MAG: efflux RND transporter periplasmic adaptor subunit [Elusimicrobiota bacterium]